MQNPNILNIDTINADWCDKDIVMLHACFQLLTDFVEKEDINDLQTNWNQDDLHKHVKKEIDELYSWWKIRVTNDSVEPITLNKVQYEEDNEMLIRLIKIRGFLWT